MEPPQHQDPPLPKRQRPIWRLLLLGGLALGGYMFANAGKKNVSIEDSEGAKKDVMDEKDKKEVSSNDSTTPSVAEEPLLPPAVVAPVKKVREPIPEDQQRELFKWVLEEKRKIKPKDPEEKKRIDEEKTILKQFIRAKSIPSL